MSIMNRVVESVGYQPSGDRRNLIWSVIGGFAVIGWLVVGMATGSGAAAAAGAVAGAVVGAVAGTAGTWVCDRAYRRHRLEVLDTYHRLRRVL
jgi:outer membrane lipoprotein SlyB